MKQFKFSSRRFAVYLASTVSLIILFTACQKEIGREPSDFKEAYTEKQQALLNKMQQTTYIVSEVFKDKTIRAEFGAAIKSIKPTVEEAITLKDLFNTSANAPYRSLAQKFSARFLQVYYSGRYMNSHKFPKPSSQNRPNISTGRGNYTPDPYDPDVLNFDDGRQVYFPYSENFNLDQVNQLTFSYLPANGEEDVNEGYRLDVDNAGEAIQQLPCDTTAENGMYCNYDYVYIPVVNDNYGWQNATLIVNFNEEYLEPYDIDSIPPPPVFNCQILTYNTTSAALGQNYYVTTTIPRWRLTNHYRGFFGGGSVILLYRISTKLGTLSQNPYGYFNPSIDGPFLLLGERTVKRKDIRGPSPKWQTDAIIWDEDWDLHEAEQKILLVSKQGFLSTPPNLQVTAGLNIGLDTSRNISASATIGLTADIDFQKTYKQRYYNTLPRTGVFTNVIGDFGAGTAKTHGLDQYDFPIRPADAFQYYFKHKVCY